MISHAIPRLTVDDLNGVVARLPAEMQSEPSGRVIGVANSIIAHFLGRDWFARHIRHDAARRGFLNSSHGASVVSVDTESLLAEDPKRVFRRFDFTACRLAV
jgi:hypothetical protein